MSGKKPDSTEPLFGAEGLTARAGAAEAAVRKALDLARSQDLLDDLDGALAQLAVEAARAVDFANHRRDPYAFAQPARELRETLARLQLDPTARKGGSGRDPFTDWLNSLDDDDAGTASPVRDPANPGPA